MNIELIIEQHGSAVKRYIGFVIFLLLSMFTSLSAAELYNFAYYSLLNGDGYDAPVRMTIPKEIISRTSPGFEDLRVYNDLGEEVECAVFSQSKTTPVFAMWDVVDSINRDNTVSVILKRTQQEGYARDIELLPGKGMFRNEVRIFSSDDAASWKYLAEGSIVDLRPRLDVYDTTVDIPETRDPYIKVEVRKFRSKERNPYLDVFLELSGIERFSESMDMIKVKRARSSIKRQDLQGPVYDQILFTNPEPYLDDEGNTIIDLGKTELPIDEVSLKVTDPYFFREVQLWAICEKGSGTYILEGKGNIYSIDAYGISRTKIAFEEGKCRYVRLKILNNGSPPLSIPQVSLRWNRRELYFIPEQQRQYAVYFGSRHSDAPEYGFADIMNRHPEKWKTYASWHTGRVEKNESYDPERFMKKWFKTFFSIGFIILILYMLGFWIIQIKSRIPRSGPL